MLCCVKLSYGRLRPVCLDTLISGFLQCPLRHPLPLRRPCGHLRGTFLLRALLTLLTELQEERRGHLLKPRQEEEQHGDQVITLSRRPRLAVLKHRFEAPFPLRKAGMASDTALGDVLLRRQKRGSILRRIHC